MCQAKCLSFEIFVLVTGQLKFSLSMSHLKGNKTSNKLLRRKSTIIKDLISMKKVQVWIDNIRFAKHIFLFAAALMSVHPRFVKSRLPLRKRKTQKLKLRTQNLGGYTSLGSIFALTFSRFSSTKLIDTFPVSKS